MTRKKPKGPSIFYVLQQRTQNSPSLHHLALHEEYGDIVRLSAFPRIYLICDPHYIQYILQSNSENYLKTDIAYQVVRKAMGTSLLTTDQQAWQTRRNHTQPFFQIKNLSKYCDTIVQQTKQHINHWEVYSNTQYPFNLANEMMMLVLKCASKILFSYELDNILAQKLLDAGYAENRFASSISGKFPWLPTLRNLHYRLKHRILDQFILEQIEKHQKNPNRYDDFLSQIIDLTVKDPMNTYFGEAKTFLMTGHETTGIALGWCWYLLSQHPESYQSLFIETDQKIGNRDITYADLSELEFTQCVFEETLRLYPPLWIIGRKSIQDDEIDGYLIPRHSHILINLHGLHHHPRYWENAEEFIPERFLKKNTSPQRYTFLPFGHGKRVCIAANMAYLMAKTIITTIAQHYEFSLVPNQTITIEHLISLRPKTGINVTVKKRNDSIIRT